MQAFQNHIWGISKQLKQVEKSIIWTSDITFFECHKERSSKASGHLAGLVLLTPSPLFFTCMFTRMFTRIFTLFTLFSLFTLFALFTL